MVGCASWSTTGTELHPAARGANGLVERPKASADPSSRQGPPRNPDGNPYLGRGIWSVRPIRAGRGSKFARAMRLLITGLN